MNFRTLGKTGLSISQLGFGAWGAGGVQWQGVSANESEDALLHALELGVNFIDTALAYGDGFSERLIKKVLSRWVGAAPVIATKVPPLNRIWPAPADAVVAEVFPRRHIVLSTEQSLRNLGVEQIDVQQLHVWNSRWTHEDEWLRAFDELKQSGKARFIGVSLTEHDPDSGIELVKSGLVDSIQVIYNIFDPTAAERLFPLAMDKSVGIIARVPLDEGGLSGGIDENTLFASDDFRAGYFRDDRKRQLVEHVEALRRDLGDAINLPETAIRFCISHPAVTTVIPGMRRKRHVDANVRAVTAGLLSKDALTALKSHSWPRNFYS